MNEEGTGSELLREVLFRSVETKLTDFACRGITYRAAHGCFFVTRMAVSHRRYTVVKFFPALV